MGSEAQKSESVLLNQVSKEEIAMFSPLWNRHAIARSVGLRYKLTQTDIMY